MVLFVIYYLPVSYEESYFVPNHKKTRLLSNVIPAVLINLQVLRHNKFCFNNHLYYMYATACIVSRKKYWQIQELLF
jgi:hypothetical protein